MSSKKEKPKVSLKKKKQLATFRSSLRAFSASVAALKNKPGGGCGYGSSAGDCCNDFE